MERLFTAFNLLYGKGLPPFETALNGLKWFMRCGAPENNRKLHPNDNKEYFSFDVDKERLVNRLSKTSFRNVVDLPQMESKELKKYSKEDRAEILRQKKYFAIEKTLNQSFTKEQIEAIDKFDKLVGIA